MTNWENKSTDNIGWVDNFKERVSLATATPDKMKVIVETILDVFESPFLRIAVAIFALYFAWVLLN